MVRNFIHRLAQFICGAIGTTFLVAAAKDFFDHGELTGSCGPVGMQAQIVILVMSVAMIIVFFGPGAKQ